MTRDLIDHVEADPDLSISERETAITWAKPDDRATIYSEERGIILSVLRSPIVTVHALRVSDDERFGGMVPVDSYSEGKISGVVATVPIGALKIKSQSRATNRRGHVISEHDPNQ